MTMKLVKPRKVFDAEKVDFFSLDEFQLPQLGDSFLDVWEEYQLLSKKSKLKLKSYSELKPDFDDVKAKYTYKDSYTKNLCILEKYVDGDWYFILKYCFGPSIKKIIPQIKVTQVRSWDSVIKNNYSVLGHLMCGQNYLTASPVRVSTCMFYDGATIQIPSKEVDLFDKGHYYFFEKNGLFLVFNLKTFETLDITKKWLCMGRPTVNSNRELNNYTFDVSFLLKFGCIDHFGFCDGETIIEGPNKVQTALKTKNNGIYEEAPRFFTKQWMAGCTSTIDRETYIAISLNSKTHIKDLQESIILTSHSASALTPFLTKKDGKLFTRQALTTQARANTKNYKEKVIPQKLSISYYQGKPMLLLKVKNLRLVEKNILDYLEILNENLKFRQINTSLDKFLEKKSVYEDKPVTRLDMSIDTFLDFLSWEYFGLSWKRCLEDIIEEYKKTDFYKRKTDRDIYPSDVAFFSAMKRDFISKREILDFKVRILKGENFTGIDYFSYYVQIKGNALEKQISHLECHIPKRGKLVEVQPNEKYRYLQSQNKEIFPKFRDSNKVKKLLKLKREVQIQKAKNGNNRV